jgi:hypothetical protein
MSGNTKEWIAVILFVVCFVLFTVGEGMWIGWRKWASYGKAVAFSLATNLFGFFVGLLVSIVILSVILAIAWDGSIDQIPGRDATLWVTMIAGILITPILLLLSKRILLWFLKMQTGLAAWIFSFVASIFVFLLTMGLPAAFLYLV